MSDTVSDSPRDSVRGPDAAPPLLRVVRGDPTPEELAALVAVVAARVAAAGAAQAEPPRRLSAWTDRRSGMRQPVHVGPGAWVASGFTKGTRTRAAW